jgi:CheY-like chemotaxis protein
MMGGEIQVESELNKGTKFYFNLKLEIADKSPKYAHGKFKNMTVAILNTEEESLRKEYSLHYINFFGVSKVFFNDEKELKGIIQREHPKGLVIFYQESNPDKVEQIVEATDLPIIWISSFSKKEELDGLNANLTIFDPTTPTKFFNIFNSLKHRKKIHHEEMKKELKKQPKNIYQLKALIAEDNPINQRLLQTTLKMLGVESDVVQNGLEAFNKYTMNPDRYDVIFTDIQMPVMDGVEFTKEVLEYEKEEGIPHTPIIAVTANVLKGDREKFLGAGMDDYISKPIEKEQLLSVLEKVAKGYYTEFRNAGEVEEGEEESEESGSGEVEKEEGGSLEGKEVIVASEGPFIATLLEEIVPAETAESFEALEERLKKVEGKAVVIVDDEFNGKSAAEVVKIVKELKPDAYVIAIGEEPVPGADKTLPEPEPEELEKIIKGVA